LGRTVLFGWEMGSALGHVDKLRIVGDAMRAAGWRTVFALREPAAGATVGLDMATVLQAPRWPPQLPQFRTRENLPRTSLTFGQTLGYAGYHDGAALQERLAQWQAILTEVKPDIAVSDYSPTLNLACRGRVPVVVTGAGYSAPPWRMERYPRLHERASEPLFDETALTENVNRALGRLGLPSIHFLPQVMEAQSHCIASLPLLDPYDGLREAPCIGPILERVPALNDTPPDRLFVYLYERVLADDALVDMLLDLPLPATLYIPGMDATMRERFRTAGHEALVELADMDAVLPRVRAVISHGGTGLATLAILAGRPQLVLNTHIEQLITGDVLTRAGIGMRVGLGAATKPRAREAVRSLCFDSGLLARANAAARDNRQWFRLSATNVIVECCEALAG